MATVTKRPHGHHWVLCRATNGKRRPIRLGKSTRKQAEDFAAYVTMLEAAQRMGRLPDPPTLAWLAGLDGTLHTRVANTGLVQHRGGAEGERGRTAADTPAAGTMAWLAAEFPKSLDVKPQTLVNVERVLANLVEYLSPTRPLAHVTAGDADDFRTWLRKSGRAKSDEPLSYATVSRRCRLARQAFEYAVRKQWCRENPFGHMADWCEVNPGKDAYVPADIVRQILDDDPDPEFRVILALARFAGVRPSDVIQATWDAVDWQQWYLLVRSPKTERARHGGIRDVPLAEAIRPHLTTLWELAGQRVEAGEPAVYLFPRWRELSHAALADRLERRTIRLGHQPWAKPWNNLRASAENDWIAAGIDIFQVARWMGHSPEVALRHYNRVAKDRPARSGVRALRDALRVEDEAPKRSAKRSSPGVTNGEPRGG